MAHKSKEPKYISFMVLSSGKKEPKTYRIRTSIFNISAVLTVIALGLIVFGTASYWSVAEKALAYSSLEEENFKLKKSLDKINDLENDLSMLHRYQNRLRKSLSGYVNVENIESIDTSDVNDFELGEMQPSGRKSIFRNVPSALPIDGGFFARGFSPNPVLGKPHYGLDIAAPVGTPIKAPADGVVLFAGWTVEGGAELILKHGYGFVSIFKHSERNLVRVFEKIKTGQIIALVGNTGKITSGPHLHFELWKNGKPVDPVAYFGHEKLKK
jgi:murein DD-endopeptidase MepM/ murein hydrolase activator NlpD